jgi:hypothetical protein
VSKTFVSGGFIGASYTYPSVPALAPDLVTSGSLIRLDAGNTSSYSGSGTTWTDLSGSGYNHTLVNSPTFTSSGASSYFTFNGSNQYANFSGSSSINITSISIFVWVYPVSDGCLVSVLGQQAIDASYHHASIDIISTGVFRTGLWNGSGISYVSSSAQSFNRWHNIGFTYTPSTLTGYLNGSSLGTTGFTWSRPNPLYLGIAANDSTLISGGVNQFGDGRISHLLLFNRELSAAEVTQNYNSLKGRYGL